MKFTKQELRIINHAGLDNIPKLVKSLINDTKEVFGNQARIVLMEEKKEIKSRYEPLAVDRRAEAVEKKRAVSLRQHVIKVIKEMKKTKDQTEFEKLKKFYGSAKLKAIWEEHKKETEN